MIILKTNFTTEFVGDLADPSAPVQVIRTFRDTEIYGGSRPYRLRDESDDRVISWLKANNVDFAIDYPAYRTIFSGGRSVTITPPFTLVIDADRETEFLLRWSEEVEVVK